MLPAWVVSDAADGTASDESDLLSFADGREFSTARWTNAFVDTRYLEFAYGNHLPNGLPCSSALLTVRVRPNRANDTACYYLEVRQTSTGVVKESVGSAQAPAVCFTGGVLQTFVTPLPAMTSSSLANDLSVRMFVRSSVGNSIFLDQAVVSIAVSSSFALLPRGVVNASSGVPTSAPWALAVADDSSVHTTQGNWATAFASNRYLAYTFQPDLPSNAVLSSVALVHHYHPAVAASACTYLEVHAGSTLLGTHGSSTAPQSCASSITEFTKDRVPLPEVDSVAKLNELTIRVYGNSTPANRTVHDFVALVLDYQLQDLADSAAPRGVTVSTSNGGLQVGKMEQDDQIIFTYSEPMALGSILPAADGGPSHVVVRVDDLGTVDQVRIYDASNTTQLPLGVLNLGGNYVNAAATFGAQGTPSVLVQEGPTLRTRLGTLNGGTPQLVTSATTLTWTPAAEARDLAGNACFTSVVADTNTAVDF